MERDQRVMTAWWLLIEEGTRQSAICTDRNVWGPATPFLKWDQIEKLIARDRFRPKEYGREQTFVVGKSLGRGDTYGFAITICIATKSNVTTCARKNLCEIVPLTANGKIPY